MRTTWLTKEEDISGLPFPLRCNPDVKIVEEGLDFMVHWFTESRLHRFKLSLKRCYNIEGDGTSKRVSISALALMNGIDLHSTLLLSPSEHVSARASSYGRNFRQ